MNKDLKSKYPHMFSFLLAILISSGLLVYGTYYAHSMEQKYIYALAPLTIPQSKIGSALQQVAFEQPDLLVVYGSSEMNVGKPPFLASQFFQNYPTGFDVYVVAKNGAASLDIAEDLAAIGPELRGKKVVFSFTPTMFNTSQVHQPYYAGDFSLLHANALVFNPFLSYDFKQRAAQRMNEYPDTLQSDSILQFGIQQLTCFCNYGSILYDLAEPLGEINIWIIRLQDHWAVLNYIWSQPQLNPLMPHQSKRIDWSNEIAQAVRIQKLYAGNNPYGVPNIIWTNTYSKILTPPKMPGTGDAKFLWDLNHSTEWTDFGLVLQALKEFGAKPLILSRPLDGRLWSAMGVSLLARRAYYDKLQKTIAPYGFPFVDFENHDGDKYFSIDTNSHTSPEGWVYVDQTLDKFFHGNIH